MSKEWTFFSNISSYSKLKDKLELYRKWLELFRPDFIFFIRTPLRSLENANFVINLLQVATS